MGLTPACCAFPAAVVAVVPVERFAAGWLAVDLALVPVLAEDCWVRFGWLLAMTEIALLVGTLAVVEGSGRGGCVRNGIIA